MTNALNENVKNLGDERLSQWVLNKQKHIIRYFLNGKLLGKVDSYTVLIPKVLDNEEMHFRGWYTDNSSHTQFVDTNITQNMEFWGVL